MTQFLVTSTAGATGTPEQSVSAHNNSSDPHGDRAYARGLVADLRPVYNVLNHGLVADGSTDNSTALTALIASVPTSGGIIHFPRSSNAYVFTSSVSFDSRRSIIFQGDGGRTAGAVGATVLQYTSSGSTNFLSGQSSLGICFRDMQIQYTSNTFTGYLLDLKRNASDTSYIELNNVNFVGIAATRTGNGIDLNNATRVKISSCNFNGFNDGIKGVNSSSDYSNVIYVIDCNFVNSINGIHNPGSAWTVSGCTFEYDSVTGMSSGIKGDVSTLGLFVSGCWTGDATVASTVINVKGGGITITGNFISCPAASGSKCISIGGGSGGVLIAGNELQGNTAIDIASGVQADYVIAGNLYSAVNTKLSGTLPAGSIYADGSSSNSMRLNAKMTGWSPATGTASRAAFDTSSVTLTTLAGVVKALTDDLRTLGILA